MSENVISLVGGPSGQPAVDKECVDTLRELLAQAEAGQIIGVAAAVTRYDHTAGYSFGGWTGSWGMLGAIEVMKVSFLSDAVAGEENA